MTEGTDEANAVRQEAVEKVMDFLVENKTKGGGMISTKKLMPSGGGSPFEDKYIEIEAVESPIKGGEFIEDAEEAHNIISYAMSVHPNLIGATPGKSKGSMGGTDKRELFMIQQAKMRPFVDRLLRPFVLIKRFNKWPENLVFAVPEFIFTTLDQDKTGKKTEIKTF